MLDVSQFDGLAPPVLREHAEKLRELAREIEEKAEIEALQVSGRQARQDYRRRVRRACRAATARIEAGEDAGAVTAELAEKEGIDQAAIAVTRPSIARQDKSARRARLEAQVTRYWRAGYSDRQIAHRLKRGDGKTYHPRHIAKVRRAALAQLAENER